MNVQEIMKRPAVTCRAGDDLNRPARLMWEHDCGAIPVVNDDGVLVGLITDRDICMSAYTQGEALRAIPVSSAMATEVFSCRAGDSLEEAERLMSEKQVRRIPILDGENRPIGVLSLSDIARYAASAPMKTGLSRDLTQTLAAIAQPGSEVETGQWARSPEHQLAAIHSVGS